VAIYRFVTSSALPFEVVANVQQAAWAAVLTFGFTAGRVVFRG